MEIIPTIGEEKRSVAALGECGTINVTSKKATTENRIRFKHALIPISLENGNDPLLNAKSSDRLYTDEEKPIAFKITSSCKISKLFVYLLITGLPSASAKRTMNFSSEEDCPKCFNIWVFVLLLLAGFICFVFKIMKKLGVNVQTQVDEANFQHWDMDSGFKY
jgi:hypothetical protein